MAPTQQTGRTEFIALTALLMSTVALSIVLMLPALGSIATDLNGAAGNQRQWVITTVFIGLVIGQLFFGTLSDVIGRRLAILSGIALFAVGSLICSFAPSFEILLFGRLLQGIGVSGPRIASVAMVRDRYAGVGMAKVMSIIMGFFIFVPMLAPVIGQGLLLLMPWRGLFVVLALVGLVSGTWLLLRQPETLANPRAFNFRQLGSDAMEVARDRRAVYATLASGCALGSMMGFVNSSQQIFQDLYLVGNNYALWFGVTAIFLVSQPRIHVHRVYRCSGCGGHVGITFPGPVSDIPRPLYLGFDAAKLPGHFLTRLNLRKYQRHRIGKAGSCGWNSSSSLCLIQFHPFFNRCCCHWVELQRHFGSCHLRLCYLWIAGYGLYAGGEAAR